MICLPFKIKLSFLFFTVFFYFFLFTLETNSIHQIGKQMTNNIHKEDGTETALDYIQRQEKLEKDAKDILPGNFDKCTFSLGYIRQPLYACKTCTVDHNEEPAGMCYSCSIACHASHDLFELFPKRAFRCDCGLSGKFGGHGCSRMVPEKLDFAANEKNQYNHNFKNLYCR